MHSSSKRVRRTKFFEKNICITQETILIYNTYTQLYNIRVVWCMYMISFQLKK